MTMILLMPSMRCNLRCAYCHFRFASIGFGAYGNFVTLGAERPARWWLEGLKRFEPYHLELTGGEPSMHDEFRQLVAGVPDSCTWAITSNTLLDAVRDVDLRRCRSWTASFHRRDDKRFIANVSHLKTRGAPISVSLVVRRLWVDDDLEAARRIGDATQVRVNLLRELNSGVDWRGSLDWQRVLAMRDRDFNVVEDEIPPAFQFDCGFLCRAGHEYFACAPDGRVARCYSAMVAGRFECALPDWVAHPKPRPCRITCYACAQDARQRIRRLADDE
jgi:hypothetical protein